MTAVRRFAGRFLASYFVIYLLPFPIGYLPYGVRLDAGYDALWNRLVPWLASRLFHLSITVLPNGSGDTTFNYFQLPCFVLLALAAAAVWTLAAKGARDERNIVRFYVRFGLGAALIGYGSAKFFNGQFPVPDAARLIQPVGTISPMGLLWRFMGASPAYAAFGGTMEIIAGLLLFWRRTLLAGSLAAAAVLLNVVMLNFSYDVPVKLYSLHLFAMAVYLAAPELPELATFLLRSKPTTPVLLRALALALTAAILYYYVHSTLARRGPQPAPPLIGAYAVEDLKVAAATAREERWARVAIRNKFITVIGEDGSARTLEMGLDLTNRLIHVTRPEQDGKAPETIALLDYRVLDEQHLSLTGKLGGQPASMTLRKLGNDTFPLLTRGFHWINEVPYSR
jgi:hypothetical protein